MKSKGVFDTIMVSLENFLVEKNINYKLKVPGEKLSTFRGGGIVEIVVYPDCNNTNELLSVINDYPYYFLGMGSNTLIDDDGYNGVVINSENLKGILRNHNEFIVGAGVTLPYLNSYLMRLNLSGLERLAGIPASIGGACNMNAGAFGSEICEFIKEVTCYDLTSKRELKISAKDVPFSYRSSGGIFKDKFIKSVTLFGFAEGYDLNLEQSTKEKRLNTQPQQPSLGSVFKSQSTLPVGYLIDKCGLKGTRAGCAQISACHANFIVNNGGAQASDYLKLLNIARDTVKRKFGITLVPEIKLLTNKEEIWEFTTQ